jgi:hypothetical protein
VEFRVATSIFRPDPPVRGLILPLTAELERSSAGSSYWGPVERQALATPLGGTRPFSHVIGLLGRGKEKQEPLPAPVAPAAAIEQANRAIGLDRAPGEGWLLLGEKKAIGLRGFFDQEDRAQLNPADAAALGVTGNSHVRVATETAAVELRVHLTDAAPVGSVVVGANVHPNRALFAPGNDPLSGDVTVPPARCRVEKIDRIAGMGGENPSVWL